MTSGHAPSAHALGLLAAAFDRLGIPLYVGGGVASATLGKPRFTEDVDLVVCLEPAQVSRLAAELGGDFEVDVESLTQSARMRRPDNLFYLPQFTRFDLHLPPPSAFLDSQMARRVWLELEPGARVPFVSREDLILSKLVWFRKGGEVSTKQLDDVHGLLARRQVDDAYLDRWASELAISDLLARARASAG